LAVTVRRSRSLNRFFADHDEQNQAQTMVKELRSERIGLDVLAVTAIVSTVAVGEHWAALVVVLMITGGEALEQYASARARREITALLARTPQQAHRIGPDESLTDIPVGTVAVGDDLLIKPGEAVPVDAVLADAEATFDESSLTGESLPARRSRGDAVLSGSVNGSTVVHVRATALAKDSQYQQIVALVEAASGKRAPFVRLADRYAMPFTAFAFLIAGAAWWISGDAVRFAEVLVVATPCPLLVAAPVAFIGGMSRAAKNGVVVKSGGVLEQLARVRTVAFDKTGTLTHGRPEVEGVIPFAGFTVDQLTRFAAAAERYSPHVLAHSIAQAASRLPWADATGVSEEPGRGVVATVEGHRVVVGKASFVAAKSAPFVPPELSAGQMAVYVAIDGVPAGQITLSDLMRGNAAQTLEELASLGVRRTIILTGDARATAEHIAAAIGITDVEAGLLPAGKVTAVNSVVERPVMMIGDGVNDAPVLAAADVGVAMGARGSTAASESADVVIMVDDLARAPRAISIAQRTVSVAVQSIWIGISLSILLMLVAAFGTIPAIVGAALQELVDLISILNSLRAVADAPGRKTLLRRSAG
jgi:ATPase, P-type (transporting), HAD superfamily, subfamily IC/heavy metal translocating P-type ATPase